MESSQSIIPSSDGECMSKADIAAILTSEKANGLSEIVSFRDDVECAAKVFSGLNAWRNANGAKPLQWHEVLCELATLRTHDEVRAVLAKPKKWETKMERTTFNLGMRYTEVLLYLRHEQKDGEQLPVHKSAEMTWNRQPALAQRLLDHVAKFGAIAVYKNNKLVCMSITMSTLSPTTVLPPRVPEQSVTEKISRRRKRNRNKKSITVQKLALPPLQSPNTNKTSSDSPNTGASREVDGSTDHAPPKEQPPMNVETRVNSSGEIFHTFDVVPVSLGSNSQRRRWYSDSSCHDESPPLKIRKNAKDSSESSAGTTSGMIRGASPSDELAQNLDRLVL